MFKEGWLQRLEGWGGQGARPKIAAPSLLLRFDPLNPYTNIGKHCDCWLYYGGNTTWSVREGYPSRQLHPPSGWKEVRKWVFVTIQFSTGDMFISYILYFFLVVIFTFRILSQSILWEAANFQNICRDDVVPVPNFPVSNSSKLINPCPQTSSFLHQLPSVGLTRFLALYNFNNLEGGGYLSNHLSRALSLDCQPDSNRLVLRVVCQRGLSELATNTGLLVTTKWPVKSLSVICLVKRNLP